MNSGECDSARIGVSSKPRADEWRTEVLASIRERAGAIDVDGLATDLLRGERSDWSNDGSAHTLHCVRIQLHHVDLPVLDEAGLVAYDPDRRIVTWAGSFPESPDGA